VLQSYQQVVRNTIGCWIAQGGSNTAFNIDSAYSHGGAGDSVMIRYVCPTADTIDELYVFLHSNGGTLGNITMSAEIYNEGSTASRPGSTSRDTSTATTMPGSTTKWIKFAFGSPYTPAVGEILWFVVKNTSASPTVDFPGIRTDTILAQINSGITYHYLSGFTSTNSGSNGTIAAETPFVVKQGSSYFGQPFTTSASVTSNTLERGFRFTPTEDIVVSGAGYGSATANINEIRILADATAPGGSALHTFDLDSTSNLITSDLMGGIRFTPITLTGGTTYKATCTFGAATTNPLVLTIEDYASYSSVFDSMRDQSTLLLPEYVIDDGAGGWTTNKNLCPELWLLIDDMPAIAGGSGNQGISQGLHTIGNQVSA
jgi:hypothetical protein